MAWHDVASWASLHEDRPLRVKAGRMRVLLVRHRDAVRAFDPICPHKAGDLREGEVVDGQVLCPVHEAGFDLATGLPGGGCDWAGVLPVYPTKVEGGRVFVQVDP